MTTVAPTFDSAFANAFCAGTPNQPQVEAVLPRDHLATRLLLPQLRASIAGKPETLTSGRHTPTGSIPPFAKPTSKRLEEKCGGQIGHAGNSRPRTQEIDHREFREPPNCPVCGKHPSVCSSYQADAGAVAASLTAVYDKPHRIEDTSPALPVEQTVARLVEQVGGLYPESVPGYHMRILDGNRLAASSNRLPETRHESAAPCRGRLRSYSSPPAD